MVLRIGGLATGMEIDQIVDRLMEAERMPLERMKQDQIMLTWKQDAFREINRSLLELEHMIFDMKLSPTYQSKTVHSSNENAVTATASSSAVDGSYQIHVSQLATNAINVGKPENRLEANKSLKDLNILQENSTIVISTYDDQGEKIDTEVYLDADDTLHRALQKITDQVDHVRAFYDEASNQVVLETTRTGAFHPNKPLSLGDESVNEYPEIIFNNDHEFFSNLGLHTENERGGENAEFIYNNELTLQSRTNDYSLQGIHFDFHHTTEENARITVSTDIDHTVEAIKEFVEKYNEIIDLLNGSQQEEVYRDFPPLTDEQKSEMTEQQIKQWEEKAKSGILRGEYTITQGLIQLRQNWTTPVAHEGSYQMMNQIGIRTTNRYMDGGKLELDENELREALVEDPESVRALFVSTSNDYDGILNRLEDSVKQMRGRIEDQAGRGNYTLDNYALGRQLKALNERIEQFEDRMVRVETRYWNQFTAMEKAIQRLNEQSNFLFAQFYEM